tara:strand:- start:512 stop:664 length:153 start_codon:yes stop_codon:yes gene_type:complete
LFFFVDAIALKSFLHIMFRSTGYRLIAAMLTSVAVTGFALFRSLMTNNQR